MRSLWRLKTQLNIKYAIQTLMRRRTLKILCIVVALIPIILVGTAYWIGLFIEQQITQVREVEHFERGWFFSEASSSLALPDRSLPVIALQHDIYHGPLPFISADTVLNQNSTWCRQLPALCANRHRLLSSKIGLSGISYHYFDVPLLQIDTLNGLLGIEDFKGELQIPLLENTPQGSLQTSLANLNWVLNDGSTMLNLSDMTLQSGLKTTDAYLTGELVLKAGYLAYGPEQAGPGEIHLRADRFNYLLLHRLVLAWQQYRGPSPDFLLLVQELLSQHPKIILNPSHLITPHGDLELEGELLLRAVNMFKLLAQPLLLIDNARIDIRIDKALLEAFARYAEYTGHNRSGVDRLSYWRQNGLLLLDKKIYHAQFRIREGRIYLNDTELEMF